MYGPEFEAAALTKDYARSLEFMSEHFSSSHQWNLINNCLLSDAS